MLFQSLARAMRVCAGIAGASCLLSGLAGAAVVDVPAGGDLQAAINAAQPGDVIQLQPGALYTGNFRLPSKGDATVFITIRTAMAAGLPPAGVRMSPANAVALAKIKSGNSAPALTASEGAHHWRVELLEFQANAGGVGDIIVLGASGAQTTMLQMPHDLVLDRLYIHGDPAAGQKRGIALQSASTQIVNSYIADIKSIGQDSQAIAGWNGSGPYLIENNYLEAAGENVLFGGADPSIPDLVPADITVRRNTISKPLQWRTEKWQIKNAFELKNARRVLIEGNVIENVWGAAQDGFAVLFTTRNQDGRAPWSTVEDVTFRYNVLRHAGNGINISGYDDLRPSMGGRRFRISHNVVYDIDATGWNGAGIFLQLGNEPREVTVDHNTVFTSGTVVSVYGSRGGVPTPVDGFDFRDNLMRHNRYGIKGAGLNPGNPTLAVFFTNLRFERNVLAGGAASQYPAANYFPTVAEFEASFIGVALEDFSLVPGSPYRTLASDGTALGADMGQLGAAQSGTPNLPQRPDDVSLPYPQASGGAVCRTGVRCGAPATGSRSPRVQ